MVTSSPPTHKADNSPEHPANPIVTIPIRRAKIGTTLQYAKRPRTILQKVTSKNLATPITTTPARSASIDHSSVLHHSDKTHSPVLKGVKDASTTTAPTTPAEKAIEAQRLKDQLLEDIAEVKKNINSRIQIIGRLSPDVGLVAVEEVVKVLYGFSKRVGGPLLREEE
jgi:hypothetical protein